MIYFFCASPRQAVHSVNFLLTAELGLTGCIRALSVPGGETDKHDSHSGKYESALSVPSAATSRLSTFTKSSTAKSRRSSGALSQPNSSVRLHPNLLAGLGGFVQADGSTGVKQSRINVGFT